SNTNRFGCPPSGEIDRVVGLREVPGQALREHLFKCSECFDEYRHALAQCQGPEREKDAWRNSLVSVVASRLDKVALRKIGLRMIVWIRRVNSGMDGLIPIGAWKLLAAMVVLILLSPFVIKFVRRPTLEASKATAPSSSPPETAAGVRAGEGGVAVP